MYKKLIYILPLLLLSCKTEPEKSVPVKTDDISGNTEEVIIMEKPERPSLEELPDTSFVRLADYSDDFAYDMKYATTDNFLKEQVYECAECYTRVSTAKALIAVNKVFSEKGYRIKFFDCYRPHTIQKKMWEIYPNPIYVADPAEGSIHNKGGAVDITLVDAEGEELDMGTKFDFFGKKAHHAYKDLPEEVIANRQLLKSTMESFGFNAITSEWWHYNYGPTLNFDVADFVWDCE